MGHGHWGTLWAFPLLVAACGKTSDDADGAMSGGGTGGAGTSASSASSVGLTGSGGVGTTGSDSGGSASQPLGVGGEAGHGNEGGTSAGGGTGGIGGGVSASCEDVTPCGGDVVGTWTVIDSCLRAGGSVDLSGLGLNCSAAPTEGSLEVTGTWSASSEGIVSDNTHTFGDATFEIPEECSHTATQPILCPRFNDVLAAIMGYASLACVDSAVEWCACSATVKQTGGMGLISANPITNGTYTTADGVLAVSDGTNHAEYSYCSFEDTLTLSLKSAGRTGTVTGTILLQKH